MDVRDYIIIICVLCFTTIDALMFHISPQVRKCLKEEIHKDVLVTGDYDISEVHGQQALVQVK